MSSKKTPKHSKKGQLRRFENDEDREEEFIRGRETEEFQQQQQSSIGYGPPMGGGASYDPLLDEPEVIDYRDPYGYSINRDDSNSRGAVLYDSRQKPWGSMVYQKEPIDLADHSGRNEDPYQELPTPVSSSADPTARKKRDQKCRLCANHDMDELMKGHKHFCPYSQCKCELCEITKNRQYYMKEQQRLTRRQEQDRQQNLSTGAYQQNPSVSIPAQVQNREYPDSRRWEMEKDLADLDMSELEAINILCKKGTKNRRGKK